MWRSPSGDPCSPRRPGPARTHQGAAGQPGGRAGASFGGWLPSLGSPIPAQLDGPCTFPGHVMGPARGRLQGVNRGGRQDSPSTNLSLALPQKLLRAQLLSQALCFLGIHWESNRATKEVVGEARVGLPPAWPTRPRHPRSPHNPGPAEGCRGEHPACTSHVFSIGWLGREQLPATTGNCTLATS